MLFNATKHVRINTLDFRPPLPNSFMQKAFQLLLPFLCKTMFNGLLVQIDSTSYEKLNKIKGERCLLLPNHPSEWDPSVLFDVARQLNENFYFVAAREVFDYSYGFRGWLFQRLGVYSLVRGSNDRSSLKTSIDILAENKGRLVIFVEGEISNQNDSLLPLESGVIQLAFLALNEAYKDFNKNIEALPSLYICPTGIRYHYNLSGLNEAIDKAILKLETATQTASSNNATFFERLMALASTILSNSATQLGYQYTSEQTMTERVSALSHFMLTKLEQVINLESDETLSYLDRIRRIRNKIDKVLSQGKEQEKSYYQERLYTHQKLILVNFYDDLARIVNFVAIYDGYLHPDMSENRYAEAIRRMEKEVFGEYRFSHPRTAAVKVSDPIDLKNHFQDYLNDKRTTVSSLTQSIEKMLYGNIALLHTTQR